MWKIIIGAVVVVLVGAGGFLYYQSSQNKLANPPSDTSVTITQEPSASPTPEVDVEIDAFSIEIQNGSGIAGEAGRAKYLVEGEDFVVDTTGNADNYDYEETVIQAKEGVSEAWIDQLKEVLGGKYAVKSSVEKLDDGDSDSDVIVIIGQNDSDGDSMVVEDEETDAPTPTEAEEATETDTPTPSPTESAS